MEMCEPIETMQKKSRFIRLCTFLASQWKFYIQCVFALIIFVLGTYRLWETRMPILHDDEFGYWASSAFFMGDDWSSVTSKIAYYSYGYGLLLAPLRFLRTILGWRWDGLYQAAVVLNVLMLVGSYFIACRICRQYMEQMNWMVRYVVCFVAVIYSSNMVYSHITLTENALYFFFWVYLYVLMRCVEKPSIKNHAFLAVSAFYLFAIHQRAVAELIAAVLIVLYMRLVKENTMRHARAFFGSFFLCSLAHMMIKGKLKNDFYRGNPPAKIQEVLSYLWTPKTLALLLACVGVMLILYLQEKEKKKQLLFLLCLCTAIGVFCMPYIGKALLGQTEEFRFTVNDFSGQWNVIKNLFSSKGIIRLLVSVTGKWFYLASATGLVICWGMKETIKHTFWMGVDGVKRGVAWIRGTSYTPSRVMADSRKADIWKLGMALSWMGSLMVCAIYKEGLYKVDDLLNGRYNEFVIGILVIYGFYCLVQDRHWIRTVLICLVLYALGGALCQHVLDGLQRTTFELSHCVMFGKVIWDDEVPMGKMREVLGYVLPMGLTFIILLKLFSSRFKDVRVVTARCLVALMLPALVWTHMARDITDEYTIFHNSRNTLNMPHIAWWVEALDPECRAKVYYLEDTQNYYWAEMLQFMLQDRQVVMIPEKEAPYEEDAFFFTDRKYASTEWLQERCVTVTTKGRFALMVTRGQKLSEGYKPSDRNKIEEATWLQEEL